MQRKHALDQKRAEQGEQVEDRDAEHLSGVAHAGGSIIITRAAEVDAHGAPEEGCAADGGHDEVDPAAEPGEGGQKSERRDDERVDQDLQPRLPGAATRPARAVTMTSDITRGFISCT